MAGCRKMSSMATARASLRNYAMAILAGKVPGCGTEHLFVAGRTCAAIDARIDYGRSATIQTLRPNKHIKEGGDGENRECRDDADAE